VKNPLTPYQISFSFIHSGLVENLWKLENLSGSIKVDAFPRTSTRLQRLDGGKVEKSLSNTATKGLNFSGFAQPVWKNQSQTAC